MLALTGGLWWLRRKIKNARTVEVAPSSDDNGIHVFLSCGPRNDIVKLNHQYTSPRYNYRITNFNGYIFDVNSLYTTAKTEAEELISPQLLEMQIDRKRINIPTTGMTNDIFINAFVDNESFNELIYSFVSQNNTTGYCKTTVYLSKEGLMIKETLYTNSTLTTEVTDTNKINQMARNFGVITVNTASQVQTIIPIDNNHRIFGLGKASNPFKYDRLYYESINTFGATVIRKIKFGGF
jgi:hypothetical protein